MKTTIVRILFLGCILVFSLSFSSLVRQEALDYGKILGDWDVEVDAGEEYYYLSMTIERSEGELKGTISESSGSFGDTPLSDIEFDGETLIFGFTAPTPPDGYERLVTAEFKVGDNKLEGFFSLDDLGISTAATATKKDK